MSILDKIKEATENPGEMLAKNMNTSFQARANELLIDGEEIIQCVGLAVDFACLTNKRLFFVDAKMTSNKKNVVSIPFRSIEAVEYELKFTTGEVEIHTKSKTYELKMDKSIVKKFANAILARTL